MDQMKKEYVEMLIKVREEQNEAMREAIKRVEKKEGETEDNSTNPDYYMSTNGVHVIDIIEEFNLNFNRGNALKYLLRAERKENFVLDLKKAVWYLEREIATFEKEFADE